jgi:aerobic-type carbon monoxide dehydrogenase small subunit (CoxS/CutS family)
METTLTFTVNGQRRTVTTHPDRPLLDVLREDLHLTGTKYGCGEGQCGACSVLVDGRRAFSCKTAVSKVDGKGVQTIEGLGTADAPHPVQAAFEAEAASQCGYCTPGMIVTAVALLNEKPHPTDDEIRSGMNRSVCRCCSYASITKAVHRAAGRDGR